MVVRQLRPAVVVPVVAVRLSSLLRRLCRAVAAAAVLFTLTAVASRAFAESAPEAVPGEFIVKFKTGSGPEQRSALRSRLNVAAVGTVSLTGAQRVRSAKGGIDHAYAKQLLAEGTVEYIEPNYIYHASDMPADPDFSKLWGLHNTGQTGGTSDIDIDAPEAWALSTGSNDVVVAILDTGVDYRHPDLAANIWTNPGETAGNSVDDDHNGVTDDVHGFNALAQTGDPLDDNGHGTHTAGTIGAAAGNNTGIAGINWHVKILPIKFLDNTGSGSTADAIRGIEYAVALKRAGVNIRVINASWGGPGYSQALEDAIRAAGDAGILFVAAAGNSSSDNDSTPNYPANYALSNLISVAAVDHNGNLATFSNFGANSVHLAAPGVNIYSTVLGGGYQMMSGTSMAAPHVSGVAALLLSTEPSLSPSDIKDRLITTAKPLSTLSGLTVAGGIVDALNALTKHTTVSPTPSLVSYRKHTAAFNYSSDLGSRVLSTDDGYAEVALPFSFPYYQQRFSRIAVSANGRIVPLADTDSLPAEPDYSNRLSTGILVLNDDLSPAPVSDGGVWVRSEPDFVQVTWVAVPYAHQYPSETPAALRFQAKLYSTGRIEFHYLNNEIGDTLYDFGASATVGIAPVPSAPGQRLLVSHNTTDQAELGNGAALAFDTAGQYKFNDYDRDGIADIISWDPVKGRWTVLTSSSGFARAQQIVIQLGRRGDTPFTGDFDGDGQIDFATWHKATATWSFRFSSNAYKTVKSVRWGTKDSTPLVGDFDGDSRTDIAYYRPAAKRGTFRALLSQSLVLRTLGGNSAASTSSVSVSATDGTPVVGDFNGDGRDEFATIQDPQSIWRVKDSANKLLSSRRWGKQNDTPIACDVDHDGADDRVMIREAAGGKLVWHAALASGRNVSFTFGQKGDIPSCRSDFDGDGKADLAVFRPQTGQWIIRKSSDGSLQKMVAQGTIDNILP